MLWKTDCTMEEGALPNWEVSWQPWDDMAAKDCKPATDTFW